MRRLSGPEFEMAVNGATLRIWSAACACTAKQATAVAMSEGIVAWRMGASSGSLMEATATAPIRDAAMPAYLPLEMLPRPPPRVLTVFGSP